MSLHGEYRRFGVVAFRRPTHGRRRVGDGALSSAFAVENSAVYLAKRRRCCSPHPLGSIRVKCLSCISLGCRPQRMASTMSGASRVSRSSRLMKLRVTPSVSASAPAEQYLPSWEHPFPTVRPSQRVGESPSASSANASVALSQRRSSFFPERPHLAPSRSRAAQLA